MWVNLFLAAATAVELIAYLVSFRRVTEGESVRRRSIAMGIVCGHAGVAFLAIVLLLLTGDWWTLGLLGVAALWILRGFRWMNERVGPSPDGSYGAIPGVDYDLGEPK